MALIDIDYFRRQPYGAKFIDNMLTSDLEEIIQEASDYVEDYLDRKIASAGWTERIVGNRDYYLILENYPITALTTVSYDGFTGDTGTHSTGDFLIHSEAGLIEWINKMYNFRGDRVYTIAYTAGYTVIPGPVKRAVALQTVQLLRPAFGGVQSNTPEVVPFGDELIISLLEKYRRKRIS